jgi:hypothetical protein
LIAASPLLEFRLEAASCAIRVRRKAVLRRERLAGSLDDILDDIEAKFVGG